MARRIVSTSHAVFRSRSDETIASAETIRSSIPASARKRFIVRNIPWVSPSQISLPSE